MVCQEYRPQERLDRVVRFFNETILALEAIRSAPGQALAQRWRRSRPLLRRAVRLLLRRRSCCAAVGRQTAPRPREVQRRVCGRVGSAD